MKTPADINMDAVRLSWAEVGKSHAHESAYLHVTGEAVYTDDIPELVGTLHAAFGLSAKAHATVEAMDFKRVVQSPGVVAVLCAKDIQGVNDCGAIIHDDPILCAGVAQYVGQPLFVVVADTHDNARRAARKADVRYQELPAVLTAEAACAAQSFVVPPMHLARGDVVAAFARATHRLKGQWRVGGQEHFYLEGQIAYAIPLEDNGMHVYSSTQHPTEMQHIIARALGMHAHQIVVECRRMGGGFGGKESQSGLWAAVAAICAAHLKCPVKLRADRDDDMLVSGKRHCFQYEYEVGYDDTGRITASRIEMVSRAGFSADLSAPVATRAMCHFDNAYYLADTDITALCARTHTQSNTAFRGFGGPQGAIAIEYILDSIARHVGRDPLDVRQINFYGRNDQEGRNVTPYGQKVVDNVIHELVAELEQSSDYRLRRQAVREFNATSAVLKKGLALTPVKFGIAFNVTHLNQAGALVHVYTDGSVTVNHGGTEMGQGVNTKVCQVVAHELGISMKWVRATAAHTGKVANTSATAASTGADINGKAAEAAARTVRHRLAELAAQLFGGLASEVIFADDRVSVNQNVIAFPELVHKAWLARIQLWSDGFYATPGLSWNPKTMNGNPFSYFSYGAAVSEVLVDTLTGESKVLRADLLYDAGQSLNPAIDVGQVEGAYIQGLGWLTTEELWWNREGRLMTHAPSTYKIPAVSDCPGDVRVHLFKNSNTQDSIHRSKAVGEPPLLLAFSAFFAIRDAVASLAGDKINPPLDAPATCESILNAVDYVKSMLVTTG